MRNLQVNGERLWASLMELAQIGATPKGGVCRLAASDLDADARRLFIRWCEEAGCRVTIDRIGNIFARRPGRNPDLPPVMTGSHLDTQPTGGRFDGAYGVMAGLEIVRTLNDLGYETEAPVEIVAWTNEEGSRFSPAMVGSGVFAGVFDLAYGLERPDNVTGVTLGAELQRIGFAGPQPVGERPVAAYFEAHIEQGPILEAAAKPIGVVTGAQGQRWYEITVTGQEAHAGPTPMPRRRDALVGAARMIDAVNRIGHAHAPYACATVGFVQVSPNSRNTIPGRVFFTVDFRHPEDAVLTQMDRELRHRLRRCRGEPEPRSRGQGILVFPADPVRSGPGRRSARCRRGAGLRASGHHQRRRSRRRLHGPRGADRDGVCSLRRRDQPQRDRGRQARRSDRRLQRAVERAARNRRCGGLSSALIKRLDRVEQGLHDTPYQWDADKAPGEGEFEADIRGRALAFIMHRRSLRKRLTVEALLFCLTDIVAFGDGPDQGVGDKADHQQTCHHIHRYIIGLRRRDAVRDVVLADVKSTKTGPKIPAIDQAVSNIPWMAPT